MPVASTSCEAITYRSPATCRSDGDGAPSTAQTTTSNADCRRELPRRGSSRSIYHITMLDCGPTIGNGYGDGLACASERPRSNGTQEQINGRK